VRRPGENIHTRRRVRAFYFFDIYIVRAAAKGLYLARQNGLPVWGTLLG
jgi:hypothetical protein